MVASSDRQASGYVSLRSVSKTFDNVYAVKDLDLDIGLGEFFSMLGPSGSGKTTVLRMIAGFETVTTGNISIDNEDITELAPFDRTVNTVFQDYALFPHMTIQDNVEYGLRTRKVPKPERSQQALEAIDRVKLAHLADRLPHQLSGGQRQRIALARALVLRPKVLLLDEPLGALDKQLREEMQVELKTIQREAGITFVFVTHDQEEAMRMSDRIAVFNEGRIVQLGTPHEVYENPATAFVAGFLGVSNLLKGEQAAALVVTMNDPQAAQHVVTTARRHWPDLTIYARARDVDHATRLIGLGADHVVPETTEASLNLSELVLTGTGVPENAARHLIDTLRQAEQATVDESRP